MQTHFTPIPSILPQPPAANSPGGDRQPRATSTALAADDGGDESQMLAVDMAAALGFALPPPSLLAATALPLAAPASPAGAPRTSTRPPNAGPAPAVAGAPEAEAADIDSGAAAEGLTVPGEENLTEEEQHEVDELKGRDREVRQHEQAHMAAAGAYARGGPTYEYTTGPDNKRYATGGEVDIDTSKVANDPEATIRKAQTVYRAAMAPAEPSGQDRQVASSAKKMEMSARQDLAEKRREEMGGPSGDAQAGHDVEGTSGEPDAVGPATSDVDLPEADIDVGSGPSGGSQAGDLLDLFA